MAIIDAHSDIIYSLKLTKNKIISCSADKMIKVWNIETGFCLKTVGTHDDEIYCLD